MRSVSLRNGGLRAARAMFLSARAERNQRHAQEGDFVFPLLRTTPHRPSTRGAAAPLIGSIPPGERNLGASAPKYYVQGEVTGEPCKRTPSESGGGHPGGTGSHPEGAARSRRRHMLRRACPRLVSPFARLLLGTFLGGTRKVQTLTDCLTQAAAFFLKSLYSYFIISF